MRIGFFVNDIETEKAGYTTLHLAMTAVNRGHEVWIIGAGDLAYDADEKIRAWARSTVGKKYKSTATYLKELKGNRAKQERITVDDLDILMLRNDPAHATGIRSWAKNAGIIVVSNSISSRISKIRPPCDQPVFPHCDTANEAVERVRNRLGT